MTHDQLAEAAALVRMVAIAPIPRRPKPAAVDPEALYARVASVMFIRPKNVREFLSILDTELRLANGYLDAGNRPYLTKRAPAQALEEEGGNMRRDLRRLCLLLTEVLERQPEFFETSLSIAAAAYSVSSSSAAGAQLIWFKDWWSGAKNSVASTNGSKRLRANAELRKATLLEAVSAMHAGHPRRSWSDVCERVALAHGVTGRTVRSATKEVRWKNP
jgi:hypothetical protein